MELKIWGKTILTVQKYLERVTRAIDSIIYKKAISSAYVNSKNLTELNSLAVSDFILNLSERKVNLINLNTICMKALRGIDRMSAKLLILKHIDERTSAEIAGLLGISDRTYFRKLNSAYEELENWLKTNNYTSKYFENKLRDEGWIIELYLRNKEFFEGTNKENTVKLDTVFLKDILKNIGKVSILADL
jgi:sRNA-binding regulator protein Hfq